MRIKLVVLAALLGCLALFLGVLLGRTQNLTTTPDDRASHARSQRPPGSAPEPIPLTSRTDERFRGLDRDGDGLLNFDKVSETRKGKMDKGDVNGGSDLDPDEWDEDLGPLSRAPPPNEARMPRPAARPPFNDSRRSRPKANRLSRYPKNLPAWFKDYDTDGDGQVGLYEWKAKGDNLEEFKKYDLNDDGFITIEELIRSGQFTTTNAPATANGLQAESGDFFYFEVTGVSRGSVWGTDVYTADSSIAAAAVHAGVVEVGQTRLVKVTLLPGAERYEGSVRNGVTTQSYGGFARSFRVSVAN
jgi:Ca2+-binding EF-hand superfamily protein